MHLWIPVNVYTIGIMSERAKPKEWDWSQRCPATMPKRVRGIHPGGRCGLPANHVGEDHTLLIPTNAPWFGAEVKDAQD